MSEQVSNELLRERFCQLAQREEYDMAEMVAIRAGWMRSGSQYPDLQRVRRALGLDADSAHRVRRSVSYENAVRLADALGLDPFEAGV